MTAVSRVGIMPRSPIRDQIEARLAKSEIDEIVSWAELEELTGKARTELYQIASSARDSLRRKLKQHFITEHGMGIRKVSHGEAARVTVPRNTRRLRSQANHNTRVIADVDLDQVAQVDRMTVLAHASIASFVRAATTEKAVKTLEAGQSAKALTPEEAAQRLYRQLRK